MTSPLARTAGRGDLENGVKKIILGQDGDWVGGRDIARFFFERRKKLKKCRRCVAWMMLALYAGPMDVNNRGVDLRHASVKAIRCVRLLCLPY